MTGCESENDILLARAGAVRGRNFDFGSLALTLTPSGDCHHLFRSAIHGTRRDTDSLGQQESALWSEDAPFSQRPRIKHAYRLTCARILYLCWCKGLTVRSAPDPLLMDLKNKHALLDAVLTKVLIVAILFWVCRSSRYLVMLDAPLTCD